MSDKIELNKMTIPPLETLLSATESATETKNEAGQSIDKIRDIIFGGQMRDYEIRFASIENRLKRESLRLRQEMEERMNALEKLVLREFETLNNKLQLEKKERDESLLTIESLLKKADDLLSHRLGNLENKSLEEIRILRNQAHEDVKNIRASVHALREELTSQIERDIDTLRKSKVDKAAIAALFTGGTL